MPGQENRRRRKRRFGLERAATVLLRLFILLLAVLAGLGAALYWRLTEGPLSKSSRARSVSSIAATAPS
jgi:cell division protein FtsB